MIPSHQTSDIWGVKRPVWQAVSGADTSHALRLDAGYFVGMDPSVRALHVRLNESDTRLSDLADVVMLSGFSIAWLPARSAFFGKPMYAASAITEYFPTPSLYISQEADPNVTRFEVKRGCLAVTRSGTVGNVGLIYRNLDGSYLSNDAIRIVPKSSLEHGYLYTFLRSGYGKAVLQNLTYGSVVGHIKTFQVEAVPLPRVDNALQERLADLVDTTIEAREEAFDLLDKVDRLLCEISGLPPLPIMQRNPTDAQGTAEIYPVSTTHVFRANGEGSEYRLDAHYYNPTAELAVATLKKGRSPVKLLRDVAERVFMVPRFKRNYVESDHGVPFLSGKNIIQVRPTDLKYLSNLQVEEMQELKLERGWTLITCSGTIGRTSFVWKNYENHAASQHILRVIPDEEIDPGYLYAFLSSSYGYEQILRYRHGSVIDEVTDKQVEHVLVPYPSQKDQEAVGDMVRGAYEKRAEAIRLEDEAQAILMNALSTVHIVKGV